MSKQSPRGRNNPTPDLRIRRAATRAARAALTIEALESRTLLSAVTVESIKQNIVSARYGLVSPAAAAVKAPKTSTAVSQAVSQPIVTADALPLAPQTYSGHLNGKVVYTSGGHGWQWNSTLGRYATDRGDSLEIEEAFGNQDQMSMYADYVLRAGGTLVPMRPVGRQTNEVVLDNDSAGVTYSGAWNDSTTAAAAPSFYDEDYGAAADTVRYRNANIAATETATATYTPNIPQAGFYPIYTWAAGGGNRTAQLYRIKHTGGTTEIRVDHRLVGNGWVYLGTYHLNSGSSAASGSVQISNQSAAGGSVVIADTIRFGNGIGNDTAILGAPAPSGYPREDENSYHWLYRAVGQGTTPSSVIGSGNVSAPSLMAEYMHRATTLDGSAVYIGFHSNAAGGRGGGLIDSDQGTPNQTQLATYTGRQINQDMQAAPAGTFDTTWGPGTTHTYTSGFGEIDNGPTATMDATIIEVAFHDQADDAILLRDPKARDAIARSTYEATLEYFDNFGGLTAPVSQPNAPTAVRAINNGSGNVVVSWTAPAFRTGGAGAATGYELYVSRDGYGFGNPITLGNVTSHTFNAADLDSGAYYFKLVATNLGGESPGSVVVGARKDFDGGTNRVLVVNGFDRNSGSQNHRYPYLGQHVDRVWARYNNSFDYVVQAGEAIEAYAAPGAAWYGFDGAQNEQVVGGQVNLNNYDAVVWLSGEESTVNETFSNTEQSLVTTYLNNGGRLFVSGAEIGWDLEAQAGGATFYNASLKTDFVADDGGSYGVNTTAGGIFNGLSGITFDNGTTFNGRTGQFYDSETPDRINAMADSGAVVAMNYASPGSGGAAVQHLNPFTGARIVNFGFPFETITTAANRNAVMARIFDFFDIELGTISGVAFEDRNDNGVKDAADPVLPGAVVTIDSNNSGTLGAGDLTFTADPTGQYGFPSMPPGTYLVGAGNVTNFRQLTTNQPLAATAGGLNANRNFRYFPSAFTDSGGNDNFYLRVSPDGTRVEIHASTAPLATPTWSTAAGTVPDLQFNTGAGDDSLTVDYTSGRPTVGDAFFTGGANATAAGDLLRVIGTGGNDEFTVFSNNVVTKRGVDTITHVVHPAQAERIRVEGGNGSDSLDFNGAAPAAMTEAVTFAAGAGNNRLDVDGGTYAFAADAAAESDNLTINVNGAGAAVTFAATQHLAALNLIGGGVATMAADGNRYLFTRGLSVDAAARLDLADNDLIYDYDGASPYAAVLQDVKDGRDGTSGITSSTAAGNTILALVDNAAYGRTAWNGEPIDATTLVGKYTYYGDANLDGKVTGDDYVAVDANLGLVDAQWFQGDFNFDGKTTGDDYVAIDAGLGNGAGSPL